MRRHLLRGCGCIDAAQPELRPPTPHDGKAESLDADTVYVGAWLDGANEGGVWLVPVPKPKEAA